MALLIVDDSEFFGGDIASHQYVLCLWATSMSAFATSVIPNESRCSHLQSVLICLISIPREALFPFHPSYKKGTSRHPTLLQLSSFILFYLSGELHYFKQRQEQAYIKIEAEHRSINIIPT